MIDENSRTITEALTDLAGTLSPAPDLDQTLAVTVSAAVDVVPGAEHAGITLLQPGEQPTSPANTDELINRVDKLQHEYEQGPCLDAVRENKVIRVRDLATDERWPAFAEGAASLGIRSVLSFPLFSTRDRAGALNLYAAEPDTFDADDEQLGGMLAAHAAMALTAAYNYQNLTHAVSTRDMIGQAKGVLMERHTLTGAQAFTLLVQTSQRSNTKVRDVAAAVVRAAEVAAGER